MSKPQVCTLVTASICHCQYRRQFCRCKVDFATAKLPSPFCGCSRKVVTAQHTSTATNTHLPLLMESCHRTAHVYSYKHRLATSQGKLSPHTHVCGYRHRFAAAHGKLSLHSARLRLQCRTTLFIDKDFSTERQVANCCDTDRQQQAIATTSITEGRVSWLVSWRSGSVF